MVSVTNPKTNIYPESTSDAFTTRIKGDTGERFIINADGEFQWGVGDETYPLTLTPRIDNMGQDVRVKGSGASSNPSMWKGRIVAGGDNVALIMGEYNSKAYLGAHSPALFAWRDLYVQPNSGYPTIFGIDATINSIVGIATPLAGRIPLVVKGAAGQTADLQQWQNSAGTLLAWVNAGGRYTSNIGEGTGFVLQQNGTEKIAFDTRGLRYLDAANEQTTIGAAGTAAALPTAPTKYLRVVDSAGTILAIPAYASA